MTTNHLEPRLGIHLGNFSADGSDGWDRLIGQARSADRNGIDSLIVSDHVVFGENLEAYARPELGGVTGGRQPTGPDGHWLEPLTLLSYLAACTQRVRLSTQILQAALRRPVVLAKALATLDVLSGGRVDLGVGVGWQREEYAASGLDFHDRGRLLDTTIETCQALWRDTSAAVITDDGTVERVHQMPKPVQAHGIPVWISGTVNRRVARRLARFGSGWIPWGDAAADLRSARTALWKMVEVEGGDPSRLRVVGHLRLQRTPAGEPDIEATMAAIPAAIGHGVTDFVAHIPIPHVPSHDASTLDVTYAAWSQAFRRASR